MLNLVRERDSKIKIQEAEFSIIHANYSLPFPDLVLQNLPKRQPVNIEVVSRLSLVSNNANNIVHKSSEIKDLESILNLLPKTTPFQFISSQLEAKINNKQLKSNEYKPTDSSQLIGSGSRDAAKIVKEWLNGFEFENKSYSKPPTSISNTMKKYWTIPDKKEFDNFIDDDEISISSDDDFQRLKRRKKKTKKEDIVLKAMMLIGPSGVGKSTIIELVSRECGFEIIEWNSSVRNSKSLEGLIEAGKSSRINGKLPKYFMINLGALLHHSLPVLHFH